MDLVSAIRHGPLFSICEKPTTFLLPPLLPPSTLALVPAGLRSQPTKISAIDNRIIAPTKLLLINNFIVFIPKVYFFVLPLVGSIRSEPKRILDTQGLKQGFVGKLLGRHVGFFGDYGGQDVLRAGKILEFCSGQYSEGFLGETPRYGLKAIPTSPTAPHGQQVHNG
jgi:hypothetical protein